MPAKKQVIDWMNKYLRCTDYLCVAQLYLKENFLLRNELRAEHFKTRILGHWGTVPGLNFIYANLNYLVCKHKPSVLVIAGPGHGAPSVLANLFIEGTLAEFYPEFTVDEKGMGKLIHDFSWPHTVFPSHVTPSVPGSILEGGELGYSLSTAFGAILDNPDLIAVVIVGDGEAETGPIAAAWHSNKFLNPKTSGAVLPIVHINGYKISNPTIYGTMDNNELARLFEGYGYEPMIVEEPDIYSKMLETVEKAYLKIRDIQKKARAGKVVFKPKWPVILLRSKKGWRGIHDFHGQKIEGSFHSHGIPIDNPQKNPEAFKAIKKWLESYKIQELVDKSGRIKGEILKYVPANGLRIGMNKHAVGGNFYKELMLSDIRNYEVKFRLRGSVYAGSMGIGAEFLRDVYKLNKDNFRIMCPDELESNKMETIFEETKRAYMWPIKSTDENIAVDGRVMEMLSEHTLQGWLQGYLLTGRHGIFVTYEAFAAIITSMVDQYAKFLKQAFKVRWRKPIASAIYVLTSLGWRQDHNGFSHQNPSFVSNVLQKHEKFCQIYYPADANCLLAAYEETLKKKDSICVIVAGKRNLPQWLTLKEAREQAKNGLGIWDWVSSRQAAKDPDVVLASAGDYITSEALFAVKICRRMIPELKIRYVNVSELTSIGLGDYSFDPKNCMTEDGVNNYFTKDKPVVFGYNGYVNDIEQILWPYTTSSRFSIHGYKEEGSTTTPFDLKIANGVSCYHLAIDLIEQGAKFNKNAAEKKNQAIKLLRGKVKAHQDYIREYGDDPPEVKTLRW